VAVSTDVSIVIPLTDARGDAVEHLRTWTDDQTHPRDRFQIVIASDGDQPDVDRDVAALLQPHDRFEVFGGESMIQLWNRAVELADCEWLLFTENHVQAEADCVEKAVEGIAANPGLDAASIEHGHIAPNVTGQLGARWFDEVYGEWFQPEQWERLNLAGFVIRRDALRSVGGHEHRYGLFAAPLLSARLDERGGEVGHFPDARILHIQCHTIDEHHEHSADYVVGESEARTELPAVFAERYFGFRPLVWNRRSMESRSARRTTAIVAGELLRALRHRSGDARWLLHSLAGRLPAAVAGVRARRRLAELTFALSEWVADSRWVPRGLRYRAYLRAQDHVVRLAQLRWVERRSDGPAPTLGSGAHSIESVGEGGIVGVHGLERLDGHWFRWSEPVVTIRVESSAGERLRIHTGGLAGPPLERIAAAYADTRRLPEGDLSQRGAELVLELPEGLTTLTLLCRPLPPGREEDRDLGLPIFSLQLGDSPQRPQPAEAVEPATVA
jgi:hypothetical protein